VSRQWWLSTPTNQVALMPNGQNETYGLGDHRTVSVSGLATNIRNIFIVHFAALERALSAAKRISEPGSEAND